MKPPYSFLSYAKEDAEQVRRLYAKMRRDRLAAWLDDHDLLPGHDWERSIAGAIRHARAFVVCLSQHSVAKSGFVQKEIRSALELAERHPEGRSFIVPVRLDDCRVPESLQRWQWVDLFKRGGYARFRRALVSQVGQVEDRNVRDLEAVVFEDPADGVLFDLCVTHGRCVLVNLGRGKIGLTQGHVLVVRKTVPRPFLGLEGRIAEFRRDSGEELRAALLKAGAPWRHERFRVTHLEPSKDERSLGLVSAAGTCFVNPAYWRIGLLYCPTPQMYVFGADPSVPNVLYLEQGGETRAIIMGLRQLKAE